MSTLRLSIVLSLALVPACSAGANGSLRVFASGEAAAEVGYPTGTGPDAIVFSDGWAVTFDHVLVGVQTLTLGGAPLSVDPYVVDLHLGRQELFTELGLTARRWDVGYRIAAPDAGFMAIGALDVTARERMTSANASIYIEGMAVHPVHGTYTLVLAIPAAITATACEPDDGTLGIVVPENGIAEGEATLHLDHLFFDSATAAEPNLRFEAWAASAGPDRRVTLETLATQDLSDLTGVDGMPLDDAGTLVAYDPPPTGLPSMDLRALVISQAITMPHWMGEGHCNYSAE